MLLTRSSEEPYIIFFEPLIYIKKALVKGDSIDTLCRDGCNDSKRCY